MKEQKLYWGMHFCNLRMFKTVIRVELYVREQKAEGMNPTVDMKEHTKYYMTEYGQIYKVDKTNFDSYELDLQKMEWFQNQDFVELCLGENMRYTEMDNFMDYYGYRI